MSQKSSPRPLPLLFDELKIPDLPKITQQTIWQIDDLLPQTQCGLCGYRDGCLPYAHAIVTQNTPTNLCVPGGDETAHQIAQIMQKTPLPAVPSKWGKDPKTHRPIQVRAVIDESSCIGCTKCLPACPVDAIIGTAKHMHSIMTDLCTGCELCLSPCPVDCISLVPYPYTPTLKERKKEQTHLKNRYHDHLNRIAKRLSDTAMPVTSHTESKIASVIQKQIPTTQTDAKAVIELARLRTQIKKLTKQLTVKEDPKKRAELEQLSAKLSSLELAND